MSYGIIKRTRRTDKPNIVQERTNGKPAVCIQANKRKVKVCAVEFVLSSYRLTKAPNIQNSFGPSIIVHTVMRARNRFFLLYLADALIYYH